MKHTLSIALLLCMIQISVMAKVKLPTLVADGIVLQREKPITIWGTADPDEKVQVVFLNKKYNTQAATDGSWQITVPPQKAGGPYIITINDTILKDVLVGDVWLCSGQSNMETPIPRLLTLYGDEISSYTNTKIHYIKIPTAFNFHQPQTDVPPAKWLELTPENAMQYSGVPYFFAKEIYEKTGVPVGIINSSVGGTPIEAWVSEESLEAFPAYLNDKRICESDEYVAAMQRAPAIPARRYNEILIQNDKGLNSPVRWSMPEYDDSEWQTVPMFDTSWSRNIRPVSGVFWLRRYIDIPQGLEEHAATLYMGRIEGADSTFINGKYVGNTTYQYPPRIYPVERGILKAGRNLIVVRMSGTGVSFVKDKPYKFVFDNKQEVIIEGDWKLRTGVIMPPPEGGGVSFSNKPTGLYNGMIAPLRNHAIKGIVWYQGESNADRHYEYYDMLTSLISDWRKLWNEQLPFLIVQLPNYMEPAKVQQYSSWAELRNVQLRISQNTPNTGLAVAIDLGEWNDIHPLNKKDVGHRLVLQARKLAYGENIVCDGPIYKEAKISNGKFYVYFKHGTTTIADGTNLQGFAIAGADGIYKPAKAEVQGDAVVVWNDEIATPKKLRYAWANNPEGANLKSTAGLPASPFQTE